MTRTLIAIIAVEPQEEERVACVVCDLLHRNHEVSPTVVVVKCGDIREVLLCNGFNPPVVLICNAYHMETARRLGERELNGMPVICFGAPESPQEVSSLRQYTTVEGLDVALAVVVNLIFGGSEA